MSMYFEKSYQRAFGTYPLKGEDLKNALTCAFQIGYRAIDTAQMYKNEADIGAVLSTCNIARKELCVTTKVHPDNFSEENFFPSVEKSLKDLQLDYVDVLLLHWPPANGDIAPSLQYLEQAYRQDLARSIGVSNYTAKMMRQASSLIDTPLITNQVEFHPLLNQDILLAAAIETGIPLSSYCSVARGAIFEHPILHKIAKVYEKTTAQIALRWILQKGVSINTMSRNPVNIRANFDIMDFTLSNIDMAHIDELTKSNYRIVTNDVSPWAPEWD